MYKLDNKVAIVTGAASARGFGHAIATRLAKEGANVAVVSRSSLSHRDKAVPNTWRGLESVAEEIETLGKQALAVTCDISISKDVDNMVEKVLEKFGKIDILVNNAGVHLFGKIGELSDDIWQKSIAINLSGTLFCSRAVAREMIRSKSGGKIINISSIFGKQGNGEGDVSYCSTKFGTIGITQCLALELAAYGINVNAVCPGLADTDIGIDHFEELAKSKGITAEEMRATIFNRRLASIPLGRLCTPEDVASMVAFLASEEASYITGQSINVNGGALMAH